MNAKNLFRYDNVRFTAGIHPSNACEWSHYQYEAAGRKRFKGERNTLCTEFGLDYDRLNCSPKDVQIRCFREQLVLAKQSGLPLFLHCRNAYEDFFSILREFET